ncbi:hypothetical protein AXF42_Ash005423 [Apostasia shenzhenica]|uniref:Cleavage stimulating factor 64 n=1 Tax=Apostasia shenzhenica TaxID=1088818 RepID=A0A2I0B6V1_9ASPA|nr:hypothetical protein AXF42_Ash005423 [Apostasia shenzhenica]
MAAKQQQQQQISGDGFTSHISGMSKSQLYDIMSQMKVLIDQNQKQARQILIDNPLLTRALFQAQIMLGMVQPPQVMPKVQHQILPQPQPAQVGPKPMIQATQPLPTQVGIQGQKNSLQPSVPIRQQQQQKQPQQKQPQPISSSSSVPPVNFPPQPMISAPQHLPQQSKGFFGAQIGPPSQSSQMHNIHLPPTPHPHFPVLPLHIPMVSSQAQPSLQNPGMFHHPLHPPLQPHLQPPLPQQPRPPIQHFSHQLPSQMPHNLGFPPSSAPQQLLGQPLFHSGNMLPPSSFPQGQLPLPSQPPLQQLYQGGSQLAPDYRAQAGTSMQGERGPWIPGLADKPATGAKLPGQPPMPLGQMTPGPVGQPPRLPLLSPEMEKAVLQQVLSLTPEQINLLPPEQRSQVIEIQEILR